MATVIITGGTGLIGKALSKALTSKGYDVIVLSRVADTKQPANASGAGKLSYASWDIDRQVIDRNAIARADYLIHLAGANVAGKRWTSKRKKEILESRTKSSELLVKSIRDIPNSIQAVISASAIGWYGADPTIPNPQPFREEDPADDGFLGETCALWERSIEPVTSLGKRLVKLRTGIVLSKEGGAVEEFIKPLKFGIAAIPGSGRQVISWVHVDDLVRAYIFAIENTTVNGIFNAVAPQPVSNKELVLGLAKLHKGKFFIPVHIPSFVLKLVLGEMSIEVLKSTTVSCDKLHVAGFTFLHPSLSAALTQL